MHSDSEKGRFAWAEAIWVSGHANALHSRVRRSDICPFYQKQDTTIRDHFLIILKLYIVNSMNILAIADRRPKINIPEVVLDNSIDLIVTLGDLTREDILQLEQIVDIPKIGVYGNHDSGTYMPELGIWNMHMKVLDYRGLRFGGFQGCVRYKENPDAIMYTQEEASQMMASFPEVDVFICHCPPRGINDEEEIAHQGFQALRDYIDYKQPRLLLHGHTYPTEGNVVKQYNSTRIEYVYEYKILTI